MTVCDRGSETHSPERKFPGANAPLGGGLTAARELGKAAPVGAGAARDGFGFRAAFGRPQLRQAGRSSSAPRFLCVQNGGAYRSTPSSRCGSRKAGPCSTRRPRGHQARCPRLRPRPRAPVWPLFRQSEIISEHAVGPKRDGKGGFTPLRLRAMRPGPNLGGIRGHPGAGRTWRPAAGPSGKPARGERAPQGAERWHSRGSRASLSPAPGSAPNLPRSVLLASLIL